VSSGLSNAWEADSAKPDEVSGLGCEFIFECPSQSKWALFLLRRMVAFQILLSVGRFEGKGLLQVWNRIPLRAPIDGTSSKLNWVLLAPAPNFTERQLQCEYFRSPIPTTDGVLTVMACFNSYEASASSGAVRADGASHFKSRRLAKYASVPGPIHNATAPSLSPCFRSFTISTGCGESFTYSRTCPASVGSGESVPSLR
jgi:hypothetical protein